MKGTRNRDLIENLLLLKSLLSIRSAQVEFVVEVQMFQLYRDALEDLLKEKADRKKKKKGDEDDDMKEKPTGLKITLAGKSYCSFLKLHINLIFVCCRCYRAQRYWLGADRRSGGADSHEPRRSDEDLRPRVKPAHYRLHADERGE